MKCCTPHNQQQKVKVIPFNYEVSVGLHILFQKKIITRLNRFEGFESV